MSERLFPTTVIGSLPRPAWLREVTLQRNSGQLSEEQADRIFDRAIESALRQESSWIRDGSARERSWACKDIWVV